MLALMASHEYPDHHAAAIAHQQESQAVSDSAADADGTMVGHYDAREDLFLEGDKATHVVEVLEGIVCAYRLLPDGQRHVASFYFPGDMIGYCCMGTHSYSAQALTAVRVRRIPRASLERLLDKKPDIARRLLKLATEELAATRDHLLCIASKSAEAKMAAFLLALSRRNETAGEDATRVSLPMTRVDIGDYLGLTIETVSRTLSKLKRVGIIALPRTSLVVLRDMERLETIAAA